RLDLPVDSRPLAYAIFAHCFTCTKNIKATANISRALAREGIAVFRFDFTGLGESEGDFADTNFSSNVDDLVAAAEFLAAEFEAPRILIGHSLGGAAILQAAPKIPSSVAVATIGAPSDPSHVMRAMGPFKEKIETDGEAEVMLAGRAFKIKKQFIQDLEMTHMRDTIQNLKKSLVVFHSPLDQTVGIENAARIFKAARHPKSFISLDKADHLLTNPQDSQYVGMVIAVWARKFIDGRRKDQKQQPLADNWVAARTGATGFLTDIRVNGHNLVADEPKAAGGTNMGPTPYDYLAAGLGACTSMTLRMYADRKKWPLESITVRLKHQKIHAKDCETCETEKGLLDRIDREIELTGRLDDHQRRRLMEIADRCPVHRTLHSEVHINTRLKE
ncbi:MAG: bifunctional alpha/beta hydrolase/OsmC family protein, partial [Desulfobacterales bacterium]